jgi:hypothetical protein
MWTAGSWLLHHDNASAPTALSIRQFLAKHSNLPLYNPFIHLTSYLPTFYYSLHSKLPLKEEDFRQ